MLSSEYFCRMKTGYIYFTVIALQFFVLFNNVSLIFHSGNVKVFYLSMGAYVLSFIILIIGVVRGAKAGSGNCAMTLLFMINLFFYVLYSFSGYLNSFLHAVK